MTLQSLIGRKIDQTQGFLEDGTRIPLSIISVAGNVVSQIKTSEHEGYNAIQLGFGNSRRPTKPMTGHARQAGLQEKMPRFFREVRVDDSPASPAGRPDLTAGSAVSVLEVFEPGDVVDVTGISKGKGFAGVVKRHGFHGGPKTHGQSDRHRAPGAIGTGTTPGRVYKGKRMAGRMGNEQVTIKNLEVLDVKEDTILVRGLVPGIKGSIVTITKVGKNKKFKPLYSEHPENSENQKISEPENRTVSDSEEQKTEGQDENNKVSEASNVAEAIAEPRADSAQENSVEPKEKGKDAS